MRALAAKKQYFRRAYNDAFKGAAWGLDSPPASWGATLGGTGDYSWKEGSSPSWGARAGAWAGDRIGSWLGGITGLGDYNIKSNSLMSGGVPKITNGANLRELMISHTEYIGDVVSHETPGEFALSNFMLNPGNASCFPWLSQIATCFQQYKFQGLVFFFKTMSSDALNSTNTALGQVMMGTNYNVTQPNFDDSFEMINTEFSSVCKPSCSLAHGIECAPSDTPVDELYISNGGAVPEGGTPQFYNFANFQIATNGLQGSSVNIGQLHVSYQVALLKPILPEAAGFGGAMGFAHYQNIGVVASVSEPLRTFIDSMFFVKGANEEFIFPQPVIYNSPSLTLGWGTFAGLHACFIGGDLADGPLPQHPRIGSRFMINIAYNIDTEQVAAEKPMNIILSTGCGLRLIPGWNNGDGAARELQRDDLVQGTNGTPTLSTASIACWIVEVFAYPDTNIGSGTNNPCFSIELTDKPGQNMAPPSGTGLHCAMDLYVMEVPSDSFPNFEI